MLIPVSTSAWTVAGGGAGAAFGATGGTVLLPVIGTVAGALILGAAGALGGLLIGGTLGMTGSMGATAIDDKGWKSIKIYHAYQKAIMPKLLEAEELQKFRNPLNGNLLWEPYALNHVGQKEDEKPLRANRTEIEQVKRKYSGEKFSDQDYKTESLEMVRTFAGKPQMDRKFHKKQYKVLKLVIERHKLSIKGKFSSIRRALDLIAETYNPKNFGSNPTRL